MWKVILGILVPFVGTTLGAMCVCLLRKGLGDKTSKALNGFAAGVMVAASIWSLIMPAIDASFKMGRFAFFPAALGFMIGILFLLMLDKLEPHLVTNNNCKEVNKSKIKRTTKLVLAVTIHNIPEGMAVGALFAACLSENMHIAFMTSLTLALGIAIQNIPEGAIISMPLHSEGKSKAKSFFIGVLSGVVEPIAALITLSISHIIETLLPYVLSFAAGTMIYVVVEELIPEFKEGNHSKVGVISFALGFVVMMILDVMLG